jgi:hypothetical protein
MSTSYSLTKAQSCQNQPNLVLLFVFSFSYFVTAKFGAFACSYFHLVPLGQFHFTFVFKLPFRHSVCVWKIITYCTAVQLMK